MEAKGISLWKLAVKKQHVFRVCSTHVPLQGQTTSIKVLWIDTLIRDNLSVIIFNLDYILSTVTAFVRIFIRCGDESSLRNDRAVQTCVRALHTSIRLDACTVSTWYCSKIYAMLIIVQSMFVFVLVYDDVKTSRYGNQQRFSFSRTEPELWTQWASENFSGTEIRMPFMLRPHTREFRCNLFEIG